MPEVIEKYLGGDNMYNVKLFNSVVDSTIIHKFDESGWCVDLVQYATYKCKIDGLIASAFLFCPDIIQIEEYIFVKQFWNWSAEESIKGVRQLEKQYCHDKKKIEMSVNSWSIGDFFLNDSRKLLDDD
ncbi:MAG: hypothetical protein NC489_34510, partial [Ruminococcus flavefaciens]|nr:hypothetical protein [Ruminococcus flavefaciens]